MPLAARAGAAGPMGITVAYNRKYQTIEGFGTCINTWQADVAEKYERAEFSQFYKDALGASALRIELYPGSAGVAQEHWQDISRRDFSFRGAGMRGETINRIATALKASFDGKLRIIGSVWSPPAWMKFNGTIGNGHPARKNFALNFSEPLERGRWSKPAPGVAGEERYRYIAMNKLRPDRYSHFAKLLVEWCRYFRSHGIEFYALSPTNEPRFSHWFESCVYSPEEYAELIDRIVWMFAHEGERPVPLFGPEHMTWDRNGNQAYLEALAKRPAPLKALSAIASHGYVDGYAADLRRQPTQALRELAAQYGKNAWITEGGFGGHAWPAPLHQLAASFIYALRDGNVSLLMAWQSVTREPDEHGLMSLRGLTKKTYAAMQFWRFIRPGMTRLHVDAPGRLDAVAFESPDAAETALVLVNRTKMPVQTGLHLAGRRLVAVKEAYVTDAQRDFARVPESAVLSVPAESITSLRIATA